MKTIKCISNENYLVSLTVGKEYEIIEDSKAPQYNRIRIIDDTNESYLYPANLFENFFREQIL